MIGIDHVTGRIYDQDSGQTKEFVCKLRRIKNWLERSLDLPCREETWVIHTDTHEKALRLAKYHFYMSAIVSLNERAPGGQI